MRTDDAKSACFFARRQYLSEKLNAQRLTPDANNAAASLRVVRRRRQAQGIYKAQKEA
jgi:hypothetical protein